MRQQLSDVASLDLQTLDFNAAVDQVFVRKTFDLGFASFSTARSGHRSRRGTSRRTLVHFPFSNGAGYRNGRIDQLFDLGSEPVERAARRPHYVKIQQILADEVPYFWLIDSRIQGAPDSLHWIPPMDRAFVRAGSHATDDAVTSTHRRRRRDRATLVMAVPVVAGVTALTLVLIHLRLAIRSTRGGRRRQPRYYGTCAPVTGSTSRCGAVRDLHARGLQRRSRYSFMFQAPVSRVLLDHLPSSLLLGGSALLIASCSGELGVLSSVV